jgi:hypothetical protein
MHYEEKIGRILSEKDACAKDGFPSRRWRDISIN